MGRRRQSWSLAIRSQRGAEVVISGMTCWSMRAQVYFGRPIQRLGCGCGCGRVVVSVSASVSASVSVSVGGLVDFGFRFWLCSSIISGIFVCVDNVFD